MNYLLCDEPLTRQRLLPFTFTRPIAKLRMGITTLEEKWAYFMGEETKGFLSAPYLQKRFGCRLEAQNLVINASFVANAALAEAVKNLPTKAVLMKDDQWIAFHAGREELTDFAAETCLSVREKTEYAGDCLQISRPWALFLHNGRQIAEDFACLTQNHGKDVDYTREGASESCTWRMRRRT